MNWDPPKSFKCGNKLKFRQKEKHMFDFRVLEQTAMVREYTV